MGASKTASNEGLDEAVGAFKKPQCCESCSEGKLPGPRKAFKAASNGGKLPGLRKVRRLLRFTGNLLGGYFRLPGDLFALTWQSARSSSSSLTGKKPVAAAYLVTAVISLTSGDSSGHG